MDITIRTDKITLDHMAKDKMDFEDFEHSLANDHPPEFSNPVLLALWKAGNGNWEEAHNLVQDEASKEAAWVHAYLHRVEGDQFNAGYWYRRAGKPSATGDLDSEWRDIVKSLL